MKSGGPAARAGVKLGDVVSAVDGKPVGTIGAQGTQMLIVNHPPGTPLSLTVTRAGGASRSLTMTTE